MWRSSRGLVPASPTFQKKHEKNEILSCLRGKHKRTHTHTQKGKKKNNGRARPVGGHPNGTNQSMSSFARTFFFFRRVKKTTPSRKGANTHAPNMVEENGWRERQRDILKKRSKYRTNSLHILFFLTWPCQATSLSAEEWWSDSSLLVPEEEKATGAMTDNTSVPTKKNTHTHRTHLSTKRNKTKQQLDMEKKTRLWQHGEGNTLLEITGADRKHFALCVCVHADGPERLREYRPARTTNWKWVEFLAERPAT